ncbi:DedA family protein [Paenibacillus sambharensis]|uniref:DedA family protein n=1 Tax=Paenibacillus sambharensis TaxID=1803190 RepID=A0A2W1LE62_9BACL|nr:DedA family protein [Paenibacillus sambharensis]PZD97376.1 DedA family protein [Paenibacillus sambharensis]
MEQWIHDIILFWKELSYAGVIVMLSIEIIPGELILPMVGYWVHEGDMGFVLAVMAGTTGGVTGPLILYALGRYGGRPLLERYGRYVLLGSKELEKAERFFDKYGPGVAFFGRFIPGVRTLISFPCGVAKMSLTVFIVYTALAMLPITYAYIYLGMKLGENWSQVSALLKEYSFPVAGSMVIMLVIYIGYKRKINK